MSTIGITTHPDAPGLAARRPGARRRPARRLRALAAAGLTAGSLLLGSPASAVLHAAPAAAGADARDLHATIEPSVVQLYVEWSGWVGIPGEGGPTWSEVETAWSCTGFFVSTTGELATAGHCVDPAEGRRALIDTFLQDMVDEGVLTPDDADHLVGDAYATWPVEGFDAGSPPRRTVYAVQPEAVPGTVIEDPLAVQLVAFRPFEEGDVALLKADVVDSVPLPVSPTDPPNGLAVTSVGFPGSVESVVDASRVRASFKTGTVSSVQISDQGVPMTEVNADLSGGMSGGPTVDAAGNVVGVNSSTIDGDQAFNFITDASDLHLWLTGNGVALAPVIGPDGGLSIGSVVAGAVGLLVVAAGVLAVLAIRRRRRAPAPVFATAVPSAADAWSTTPAELAFTTFAGGAPASDDGMAFPAFGPGGPAGAPANPHRP